MTNAESARDEQTVLITGASAGIGQATAKLLSAKGYRVFGTSRNPTADQIDGYEMLPLEVTSNESVQRCVTSIAERTGGRIDVLINNVGTGILGAAEESSLDQIQTLFDINVFGAMRMTNAVLPLMRERRSGRILLMSSSGGVASIPYASYYCATKHALEAYGESLRMELSQLGIWVTLIAPGPVSTRAGEKAIAVDRPMSVYQQEREKANHSFLEGIRKGMPSKRVAEAILRTIRESQPRPRRAVGVQSVGVSFFKSVLPARMFESVARHAADVK